MSTKLSTGRVRQAYKFIEAHRKQYSVQAMCQVLEVAPSGYYDWLKEPLSKRAQGGCQAASLDPGVVQCEPRHIRCPARLRKSGVAARTARKISAGADH